MEEEGGETVCPKRLEMREVTIDRGEGEEGEGRLQGVVMLAVPEAGDETLGGMTLVKVVLIEVEVARIDMTPRVQVAVRIEMEEVTLEGEEGGGKAVAGATIEAGIAVVALAVDLLLRSNIATKLASRRSSLMSTNLTGNHFPSIFGNLLFNFPQLVLLLTFN